MVSEMRQASAAAHEANNKVSQRTINTSKKEIEDDELQDLISTNGLCTVEVNRIEITKIIQKIV